MNHEYTGKYLSAMSDAANLPAKTPEPSATLHAVFEAIVKGDFDTASVFMADEIELTIGGFGPINGAWKGKPEVLCATRKNYAQLENQKPVMEGMIAQGLSIAVLMHESGVVRSTRQGYKIRGVQWFTFTADGKIRSVDQILTHE
jgi:ketosteroid isomerase-like protein